MNLRDAILTEHTKTQTDKIVRWVGNNQKRFDELFALFAGSDKKLEQRAAWPLSYVVAANPDLVKKHFGSLVKKLKQPGIHNAVRRNGIRLMQAIEIPEKYQGEVMNLCFDYIADPKEKAAVKAFSLTVLQNLSRQYPEIKPELKTIIEDRWDMETAAFRARARKVLKSLSW